MAHAALTAETPLLRGIFRQRADLSPFDLPHPVRERATLIVIDVGALGFPWVEFLPVRFLVGVNSASTLLQAAQVHPGLAMACGRDNDLVTARGSCMRRVNDSMTSPEGLS